MKIQINKLRNFYWVLLGMTSLFLFCSQETSTEEQTGESIEFPDQEGWKSTLSVTREGKKSAVIRYGHMEKFSRRRMVYFGKGVNVDFFRSNGQFESNLVADSAFLNEATNDMNAIHNVVVMKGDTTLLTSSLKWSNQTRIIASDTSFTMITQKQDTLVGDAFEMEQVTGNMKIIQSSWSSRERLPIQRPFSEKNKSESGSKIKNPVNNNE
jgi:LPS export ABC transporter protein LptC